MAANDKQGGIEYHENQLIACVSLLYIFRFMKPIYCVRKVLVILVGSEYFLNVFNGLLTPLIHIISYFLSLFITYFNINVSTEKASRRFEGNPLTVTESINNIRLQQKQDCPGDNQKLDTLFNNNQINI
jgi:hypothetical protein